MPLFLNKFTSKKSTPRKLNKVSTGKEVDPDKYEREFGLSSACIKIHFGDQDLVFEKGDWISESGSVGGAYRENKKLSKYVKQLQEENNILKMKCEILLDMATETTAECHIQQEGFNQSK